MNDITFQRNLQSVLFDNKYDRYVANRKHGKLNTKGLARISYSDKIFKKKEERKNKDYSIALLVDCSGSMERGNKDSVAFNSAQKLSRHLSSAGINHSIYGFNTGTYQTKAWNRKYDPETSKKLFSILNSVYFYYKEVLGKHGEYEYVGANIQYMPSFKKIKAPSSSEYDYRERGAAYNNDSHALRFVAREMRDQPGTKIMIVLSDGRPASAPSVFPSIEFPKEKYGGNEGAKLRQAVKDAIASGIDVHSIGIQDDSVNDYYPENRCCACYDLAQIYDHIIKIIKLNLKRV